MRISYLTLLVIATPALGAASITLNTSCSPSSVTPLSSPNTSTSISCESSESAQYGSFYGPINVASASVSFALLGDGFSVSAYAHSEALACAGSGPVFGCPGSYSSAAISETVVPSGTGSGFVKLAGSGESFNGGAASGGASLKLGSMGCGVSIDYVECTPGTDIEVPIELGVPLQLSATAQSDAPFMLENGDGTGHIDVTATFYEADGTTPVSVFEADPAATPEPATPVLTALGLLALGWKRKRSKLRQEPRRLGTAHVVPMLLGTSFTAKMRERRARTIGPN
jgi:hypothetical protein